MANSAIRRREGETLKGKYRLDRLVAIGGMGEVYQATNIALDRTVAVKLLLDEFVSDEGNVRRFLLEARAANMVLHKNIVQVFDIDRTELGTPFIVQEFLRGESLSRKLRRLGEGLPAKEMLDILIPVCDAIGEAHAAGIIHRDIKPSNIYLAKENGAVVGKVLDFGISRVASDTDDVRLTKTTMMLGSPAYMSPEQIQSSRNATVRSDVWSIGAMMYELLSGRLPFSGENTSAILVEVCTKDPVSLQDAAPGTPSSLIEVVSRCMSRPPEDRYLDGHAVASALREVRENEYTAKKPVATVKPEVVQPRASFSVDNMPRSTSTTNPVDTLDQNTSFTTPYSPDQRDTQLHKRKSAGQETFEGPNYSDIISIVAAVLILAGVLIISVVFTPADIKTIAKPSEGRLLFQLALAGGVYYLAVLVKQKSSEFLPAGITTIVFGLFGIGATLVLLALAFFINEKRIIDFSATLMSLSVATTSTGLAIAGFDSARQQLLGPLRDIPTGIVVVILSIISGIVGLQFLFSLFK